MNRCIGCGEGETTLERRTDITSATIKIALGIKSAASTCAFHHYSSLLSDQWIGDAYEIFRVLVSPDRGVLVKGPVVAAIARDLKLIRIPLEKHEIADHYDLKGRPMQMARLPQKGDETDIYTYAPKDQRRSHIMSTGVSARESKILAGNRPQN